MHNIRKIILMTMLFFVLFSGNLSMAQEDYTVDIDPANFVAVIDSPYFPRIPGMRWVYEGETADGLERNEIEILTDTRSVMGVQVTIMRDTVYVDGELVEDTMDWFAQDRDGNVWYFGEDVKNYENGQLADSDGSWEAGVDGALPGIVMFGDPSAHIGEIYRQEYYAGEAEDTGQLLTVTAQTVVPYGEFENVVLNYDFTPLELDAHEIKYYAEGIGVVKELDLVTGAESVLIEFSAP